MAYDISRLQNVRRGPNGTIQAACPICRAAGGDSQGVHLSILPDGRFNCAKIGKDLLHNRAIRGYLLDGKIDDVEFVEPQPRLEADPVFSEDLLSKLIKDHSYWINRGIREEVIAQLEGGVSSNDEKSKLSNRYVIPIRGLTGQINGFSGRILTNSTLAPKYKHLFRSSRACWPWHISGTHIEKTRKVVLQEGWSEWLALENAGIHNSLSLFGLNISDVMVSQLVAMRVEEVIISTNDDPDESRVKKGKRKALDIKAKLDHFFDPSKVRIRHPKSDWGEATVEEMEIFKQEIES